MSSRLLYRGALIVLASAMAWTVVSCASAPPAPAPTPTATPTPSPTPEPVKTVEPVSAAAFQAARDAIAEAVGAGAETLAPELLAQAKDALAQAEAKAAADPDVARGLLKTSIQKANEARDAANAAKAKALADALEKQAAEAKAKADAAAAQLAAERAKLKAELDALDVQAAQAVAEAENAGAAQYAAEALATAQKSLVTAREQAAGLIPEAVVTYRTTIDLARQARDAAHKAALETLDRQAQQAIAEAEAAEADQYAPAPLAEARVALTQGRSTAATNPTGARASMVTAAEKAVIARDASLKARTQSLLSKVDQAVTAYKALQPDRWTADEAGALLTRAEAAKQAVTGDYATGFPQAQALLTDLDQATTTLGTRLKAAQTLKVNAQKALDEAEAADAYVWVPELVQSANDAFFAGTGAWKKFRLDAAEEGWNTAAFQAQSATAKAKIEVQRRQTEKLMLDTMKKLEDASGKTVVDPNDKIIPPSPWDGKQELERLKKKPVSLRIPTDGTVAVLGEKQRVTYLDEAKDQWVQGVRAMDAGDLTLANEFFLQAQRLIDTYLAMAVDKVYTVKLNPERRDSLWRIAEFDGIYATPWLWPKIWQRNQKLIQNPDLIYPGWQLIIPPQ